MKSVIVFLLLAYAVIQAGIALHQMHKGAHAKAACHALMALVFIEISKL